MIHLNDGIHIRICNLLNLAIREPLSPRQASTAETQFPNVPVGLLLKFWCDSLAEAHTASRLDEDMLNAILLGQVNVAGLKIGNWGGATECVKYPLVLLRNRIKLTSLRQQ